MQEAGRAQQPQRASPPTSPQDATLFYACFCWASSRSASRRAPPQCATALPNSATRPTCGAGSGAPATASASTPPLISSRGLPLSQAAPSLNFSEDHRRPSRSPPPPVFLRPPTRAVAAWFGGSSVEGARVSPLRRRGRGPAHAASASPRTRGEAPSRGARSRRLQESLARHSRAPQDARGHLGGGAACLCGPAAASRPQHVGGRELRQHASRDILAQPHFRNLGAVMRVLDGWPVSGPIAAISTAPLCSVRSPT